jgi:hypothetical protein
MTEFALIVCRVVLLGWLWELFALGSKHESGRARFFPLDRGIEDIF